MTVDVIGILLDWFRYGCNGCGVLLFLLRQLRADGGSVVGGEISCCCFTCPPGSGSGRENPVLMKDLVSVDILLTLLSVRI